MLRAPRTTLFVATAIALSGCGDLFVSGGGAAGSGGTTSSGGAGAAGGTTTSGGGGGASAGSGGGGATCDDSDADGDGSSLCDGDCDDTNPFIHPGALEICADGADEDCDGIDNTGSECNAYTIYVSPLGNPGATGKKADPVASVAEGVGLAMGLGDQAAVLVAAGTYVEDLTVKGKISVIGGYATGDWSVRDSKANETILKSSVPEGVRLVDMDGQMLVDGFTIAGRAVSVGADSSVALTIDGGGPVVSHTKIVAGQVSVGIGDSIGVRVIAEAAAGAIPRLWLDEITAGPSSGGAAYGILMDAAATDLQVAGSRVTVGKGTDSVGLLVADAATAFVWKNTFQSGTAIGSFQADSSSLGFWARKGAVLFDSNLVNADQLDDPPNCFTPGAWCGGVRISTGVAVISNNILLGSASDHSAAIHLLEDDGGDDLAGVVVTSNSLYGSGHSAFESESACIVLGSPRVEGGGGTTMVGRLRNNILVGGFAVSNYGVREQSTDNQTCDPAALDHNLFFFPINNPNQGVPYWNWTGLSGADLPNIEDVPGDGNNLLADPKLTTGHIGKDSPCRNAGTDTDAPDHDRDDDPRPQESSYDIGPDELLAN